MNPMPILDSAGGQATPTDLVRWRPGAGAALAQDAVAREEPLEIRVRGRCIAVTMRTPGQDAELAAGFLLGEGVIRGRSDILEIAPCRQAESAHLSNILNVFLTPALEVDFDTLSRHVYASSSCGLCGKTSIESLHQQFPPIASDLQIRAETLLALPDQLRAVQRTFDRTGGLHAAAVFDVDGRLLVAREDVGRHNAVDKAIGWGLLQDQLPFDARVLLVSGRASFEILQKALAARIPVVAAISAPSSLAVEFARASGQTLVGFLREGSMNIYAGAERVLELDCMAISRSEQ